MDKVDKVDFVMIEFDFGSFSRKKGGKKGRQERRIKLPVRLAVARPLTCSQDSANLQISVPI